MAKWGLWLSLLVAWPLAAQTEFTPEQQQVAEAMRALSAANHYQSGDPQRYADLLCKRFSRWTMGNSATSDKSQWLAGIASWRKRGWGLVAHTQQIIDIQLEGDFAFSRRVITEAYIGPEQQSMMTTMALAESWQRQQGAWCLLQMTVQPLKTPQVD